MPTIPDPELISEAVEGAILTLPGGAVLLVGERPAALVAMPVIFRGPMIARYAIPLFSPPSEAVIPGLLIGERGGFIVGREAWDFIQTRFQLFPRADVIGCKPDGSDAQVFLRELDLASVVRVLLYDSRKPDPHFPLAEVKGLIIGNAAPNLPELLAQHLSEITDLEEWITA